MCSGIPTWKQLITHTLATHERISLIITIFSDHIQTKMVNRLDGDDAQAFIDAIDEVRSCTISNSKDRVINFEPLVNQELDKLPPEFRRKCLLYSSNICGHRALIPSSLVIPLCYDQTDPPLYCSGYADIWKGKYYGRDVAAKGLRVHRTNDLNRMKKAGYPQLVYINELTMSCTGVLQGDRYVEIPSSYKRVATVGRDSDWESACNGIGVDEEREHQRVCEGAS